MSDRLRVAVVSHGHPEIASGGAQEASYWLFQHLKTRGEIDPVYIARCPPEALGHAGSFAQFRARRDEILWSPPGLDWFRLTTLSPAALRRQAVDLCRNVRPDIIHFHHYAWFGTDLFRILKEELGIPVVLTLWEYLAICHREGQMLKTNGQLCYAASHAECSACFPDRSAGKFFLRKALTMENFACVDRLIAPSEFSAKRYIEWGIDPGRIEVIENPLSIHRYNGDQRSEARLVPARRSGPTRFGFFGRLTPYKGVDVLLSAIGMLDEKVREQIKVLLYGFLIDPAGNEFQRRVAAQIEALKGCVVHRGEYRNEDVVDLMRSVDWVVVPSIWWESYSFVIHEAKAAGVPVLCSNIGLMREKVRPGIDGAHFMVADSADLADKISAICAGELRVDPQPGAVKASTASDFVDLYRRVVTEGPSGNRSLPPAGR